MTQITENDIMLNNEKYWHIPLSKKMTGITEIDVMINNEKRQVCAIRNLRRVIQFQRIEWIKMSRDRRNCLKKWQESQKMTLC